jgi:uncharacterized protein YndB with AHSA1/START domain
MRIILKQIYIEAPPDVVYDFLTSPEKLARWMGVLPDQKRRQGRLRRTSKDLAIRGGQLKQFENSKVVFCWEVNAMGKTATSVVVIELERRGNGTWVRLAHKESAKRLKRSSGKRVTQAAQLS